MGPIAGFRIELRSSGSLARMEIRSSSEESQLMDVESKITIERGG
jgi:hypothetical protein